MYDVDPETVARFARTIGPEPDDIIEEMDARADQSGFPTVGPEVGGWLRLCCRLAGAKRVFEFGSGFGYSAYWMAPALPEDGELVLTEIDEDELDDARAYLERGGYADRARFELGDAIEAVGSYDGPFDLVLVDCQKERYREAFEAVRGKLRDGGVIVADNAMTAGPMAFEDLLALQEGEDMETTAATRGVHDYLTAVREAPDFETGLLPLGEGLAVSVKTD
ncbi:O-methyltransferase [Natronomonas sp. EA1]|uniref:O-methyltransferase n=1 Tax=Natronomonas sp. EA1 TaxID=3421655 RepID=UPI003EB9339B